MDTGARGPRRPRTPEARRQWRLAFLFAGLSAMAVAAAAYAVATVSALRGVEATWRSAMAVDGVRSRADGEVLAQFRALGAPDDPAAQLALEHIGREAAAVLGRHEQALRARRILDPRTAELRGTMADALEFRRRQMSPGRRFLGDTPLRRANAALDRSLRRWRLRPRRAEPAPVLDSVRSAAVNLRHMVDHRSGTLLVATDDTQLYAIDVDHDTANVADLGLPPGTTVDAIAVARLPTTIVVLAGGRARAYTLDLSGLHAAWERPATAVASGEALWIANGSSVVRLGVQGEPVGPEIALPRGRRLAGLAGPRLVLAGAGLEPGPLDVWDPAAPAAAPVSFGSGSVVATNPDFVAFQPDDSTTLQIARVPEGGRFSVDLPRTDAGPGAFSHDGRDLAFPAGPLAGRVATMVFYHSVRSSLTGLGGPSAAIDGGVVWSEQDEDLFWLTPEGRIAMQTAGQEPRMVRTPYTGLTKLAGLPVGEG